MNDPFKDDFPSKKRAPHPSPNDLDSAALDSPFTEFAPFDADICDVFADEDLPLEPGPDDFSPLE